MCKECTHEDRKLDRRAKTQGSTEWLRELKTTDNKGYRALSKCFKKHMAAGNDPKTFCVVTWKNRFIMRSGSRISGRAKMMWEREFVDLKATTDEGNMAKGEATALWNKMNNDP